MAAENYNPEKNTGEYPVVKYKTHFLLFSVCLLFIPVSLSAGQSIHEQLTVRYAKGFQVEYRDAVTLVTVTNPWPGAKTRFSYLLKKRGTVTPPGYDDYQVVEVPVKRLISLSTTHLAFLDELGLVDRLVGFSSPDRVYTPSVRKAIAAGKIKKVGLGPNLQIETILDLQPDLILTYGSGTFRDAHPKLLEAGLKVAINGEYMESHPLGRAEWLKFVAVFFDKGKEAEHIFAAMEARYLKLASLTKDINYRPPALTNTPFSGRWYVARGKSYAARFLADAGADYIWKDLPGTGSMPMDIEMVYERGAEADFWINTGIWTTLAQAVQSAPRMATFKAIREKRLYNRNRRVNDSAANDYWESGMVQPDVILADLIRIFHPELLPNHELYYYQRLP